jgi:hypothetical protein
MFERILSRRRLKFSPEMESLKIFCKAVVRDTSMRREPPSHQRRVAVTRVHLDRVDGILTVSVKDLFAAEIIIFFNRIICPKSVGIDRERLLLGDCKRAWIVDTFVHYAALIYRYTVPRSTRMNTGGLSCSNVLRPRR